MAVDIRGDVNFSTDPPRRHAFIEAKTASLSVTSCKATLTISPPKGLSEQELERWEAEQAERRYQLELEGQRKKLEPAYRSERAAKVLELLGTNDHTGATLYRIYELAEGHPSNRKSFHKQFKISDNEFSRFQDAVHNYTVSGDWARHSYDKKPATSDPMSKKEAEAFVRGLAKQWLAEVRQGRP